MISSLDSNIVSGMALDLLQDIYKEKIIKGEDPDKAFEEAYRAAFSFNSNLMGEVLAYHESRKAEIVKAMAEDAGKRN